MRSTSDAFLSNVTSRVGRCSLVASPIAHVYHDGEKRFELTRCTRGRTCESETSMSFSETFYWKIVNMSAINS
jgi:hypothetical protein